MTAAVDDRDLLRLLRRLAGRGACLVAGADGYRFGGDNQVRRGDGAQPVDAALAEMLRSRGLLEPGTGGSLVLNATAHALLRRHLAGGADSFAAQHQSRITVVIEDGGTGRRPVLVNQDESPLAWLRRHKGRDGKSLIGVSEFAAGERLRSDYERGRIMPRVTANWSATVAAGRRSGDAGGLAELTEAAIGARRRVDRALDAVGPDFAGLLVDFCCFLKGLEEIERARLWPARSAKLVLRLALASLARHYGITTRAAGPAATGQLRHWGADGYRPTID